MSAGCQKSELESPFGNELPFVASVEAFSSQTKTAMNSDRQVLWTANDRVAIFRGSTLADEYAIGETSVGKSHAVFNPVDVEGGSTVDTEYSSNVAFYPYADDLSLTGHENSYEVEGYYLPSVQRYVAASFGDGSFPMVAVTANMADRNLKFKNVLGAMKLQLKGTQVVKSIKVEGANGEKLSGAATVTAYAGNLTPVITMTGTYEASKSVTLDCGDGVQLNTSSSTDFIIALPPVLFKHGFNVTITDANDEVETVTSDVANTILRSSILVMPEVLFGSDDEDSDDEDMSSLIDYVDEYGINHGNGVKIGETVWAPVNCGYHATDYQWGKLYQWGRKYGQGYDGDATTPRIVLGPVDLAEGQSNENFNTFYIGYSEIGHTDFDWISGSSDLWESGELESPRKSEYDPCPQGWRVPTRLEIDNLFENSQWGVDEMGKAGRWFCGMNPYSDDVPQIFLSAAGYRDPSTAEVSDRGNIGRYWSSTREYQFAPGWYIYGLSVLFTFDKDLCDNWHMGARAAGYSVRCVQNEFEQPVVATYEATNVTQNTATLYGKVSEIADSEVIERGFVWSLSPDPTINDQKLQIGRGVGEFSAVLTNLTHGTKYYVRAFAQSVVGVAYGNEVTFSTYLDYIDEYGINHGLGVEIDGVVWAPVNCGYHATDYQWGKLYQWGRKYGQGYDGSLFDIDGNVVGSFTDATVPELSEGAVLLQDGQSGNNENVFFVGPDDWLFPQDVTLWNTGTEESPKKTEYDPCPQGWRVPTYAELEELSQNRSEWTTNEKGQPGYWFSGKISYTDAVMQVFLPAAGSRDYYNGDACDRGDGGRYWSSMPLYYNDYDDLRARYLTFINVNLFMSYYSRSNGYSVRCVQVTDEVAEL